MCLADTGEQLFGDPSGRPELLSRKSVGMEPLRRRDICRLDLFRGGCRLDTEHFIMIRALQPVALREDHAAGPILRLAERLLLVLLVPRSRLRLGLGRRLLGTARQRHQAALAQPEEEGQLGRLDAQEGLAHRALVGGHRGDRFAGPGVLHGEQLAL